MKEAVENMLSNLRLSLGEFSVISSALCELGFRLSSLSEVYCIKGNLQPLS